MDDAQTSRDDFSPECSSIQHKRIEPEASCASMRSDWSMDHPLHFKSGDYKPDLSSFQQKRSEPESESSRVSIGVTI
ncbi:hypothetical protein QQF64_009048 [Cirrhinus molitorella]|uniref:Uncharacterized protein n=1 Tax=Cirrhinus molitorella TaxID=172907 RepID=A0ABR3MAC2_9TELE